MVNKDPSQPGMVQVNPSPWLRIANFARRIPRGDGLFSRSEMGGAVVAVRISAPRRVKLPGANIADKAAEAVFPAVVNLVRLG